MYEKNNNNDDVELSLKSRSKKNEEKSLKHRLR